jgi:uncharacterized protein with NRDE domain
MCTLIIGRDVIGPRTVVLGANRDENPGRASDPPRVLVEDPWIVGGRDRVAGGTWLAVREGEAAIALLNRYDPDAPAPPRTGVRSRGLLTLDAASVSVTEGGEDPLSRSALRRAQQALEADRYAPFTLVFASARSCWALAHDDRGPARVTEVASGWSVLTHRDLNDPSEPRTVHLLERLRDVRPRSLSEAEEWLATLLRSHGLDGTPPVCLHEGRMVTVSSSLVAFAAGSCRYLHADGRPCEHAYQDVSGLLSRAAREGGVA